MSHGHLLQKRVSQAQQAAGAAGALSYTYIVNTATLTDLDPTNDYISFNAYPYTSATQIKVDDNPYGVNTTLHDLFLSIQSGYLTLTRQSDPSTYVTYQITSCVSGTSTNEGAFPSYVIFNVSLVSTYGVINDEDFVTLSIGLAGPQGPAGDSPTGATGYFETADGKTSQLLMELLHL